MILHSIPKACRRLRPLSLTISTLAHKQVHSHSVLPTVSSSFSCSSSLHYSTDPNLKLSLIFLNARFFSSNKNNGNSDDGHRASPGLWKFTSENDASDKSLFGEDGDGLTGYGERNTTREPKRETWTLHSRDSAEENIFEGIGKDFLEGDGASGGAMSKDNGEWADVIEGSPGRELRGGDSSWKFGGGDSGDQNVFDGIDTSNNERLASEESTPWNLSEDEDEEDKLDVGVVEGAKEMDAAEEERKKAEQQALEKEEKALTAVLKGPDRAFGDLVAASGISDAMLDSLMALKDFKDIEGLPPLPDIEDERYQKTTKKKSVWGEIERQKQEVIAKSRVRTVDEKGRAYGTGRRKCSIARVWIQPGDGKFSINDKDFDVYFPMLDHRAALLRPFSETHTLGLWDVNCTVKGGGTSGQVGAIRLGISRALQNWEPGLRPPLKRAGFLTRDARVVERKKPGKAKARKSFQWVKR
ncbi:hypothetical protein Dimus_011483 [Dionaea muscipula]